jgi:hypothetical protein
MASRFGMVIWRPIAGQPTPVPIPAVTSAAEHEIDDFIASLKL